MGDFIRRAISGRAIARIAAPLLLILAAPVDHAHAVSKSCSANPGYCRCVSECHLGHPGCFGACRDIFKKKAIDVVARPPKAPPPTSREPRR